MKNKIATLYEVKNGKIISVKARETKATYVIADEEKRNMAFGYRNFLYKKSNDIYLSPSEAIQGHINKALIDNECLEGKIKEAKQRICDLRKLEKEYTVSEGFDCCEIYVWPDSTWYFSDDIAELPEGHSDDYSSATIPTELTQDEIEIVVQGHYNKLMDGTITKTFMELKDKGCHSPFDHIIEALKQHSSDV